MSQIEIYCDESRPDVFTGKKKKAKFLLIGALKILSTQRAEIKNAIAEIQKEHDVFSELKWNSSLIKK